MSNRNRLSWLLTIAAAGAVGFGVASVAGALADTPPVTFFACNKAPGPLTDVGTSPPSSCKGGTVISWNQTGPAGPAGPPGPAGAPAVSVLGGGTPDNVTSGTVWYMALYAPRYSTTESVVSQAVPAAGAMSKLRADAEIDPGCFHPGGVNCAAQYWTLTVMKNGAPTSLTCQIVGSSYLDGTPRIPCSNTSVSVGFSAGDLVSIRIEGSEFGPVPSPIHWTAAFTAS